MSDPHWEPHSVPDLFGTEGSLDAEIAIVGESWGYEEERAKKPFVGSSGAEYRRMLFEAGLAAIPTFWTNLFARKPKDDEAWRFFHPNLSRPRTKDDPPLFHGLDPSPFALNEYHRLWSQLTQLSQVKCVIATGNYALWALTEGLVSISSISTGTGATVRVPGGITSWRGSHLELNLGARKVPLLPIIHPAAIQRAWYQRSMTVQDLRRAHLAISNDWRPVEQEPTILAPPSFEVAMQKFEYWLDWMESGNELRLAHDIETARQLITCMGFATGPFNSSGFAMVLPLCRLAASGVPRPFDSYWPSFQEAKLTRRICQLLSHKNVRIEGQNYIYDTQYIYRFLGFVPKCDFDTMLAHHLLFPGTPKALDYLSSLYCHYHLYWKDDNKDWDLNADETTHLIYNGVDCLRTYECATTLRRLICEMKQEEQWEWEKKKANLALRMMFRGIRVDKVRRARLGVELLTHQSYLRTRLSALLAPQLVPQMKSKAAKPWYQSTRQQAPIFYTVLGLPTQRNRKTGSITVDDEALLTLKGKFPELGTLFDLILESRSVQVYRSNFVEAELEPPDFSRMSCSFGPAGTETFRWNSSTNAFGRGTNLQNVPMGEEE